MLLRAMVDDATFAAIENVEYVDGGALWITFDESESVRLEECCRCSRSLLNIDCDRNAYAAGGV